MDLDAQVIINGMAASMGERIAVLEAQLATEKAKVSALSKQIEAAQNAEG